MAQRLRNGLATGEYYDDQGFDEDGFDREGYDREGYNAWGNDRWGNRRPKRNDALIEPFAWAEYLRANRLQVCQNSPDHRDDDGYDFEGYDVDGYDEDGFDRDGLHRNGIDRIFRTPQDRKDWETLFGPLPY
ncbi:MAG: hypothetical protein IJU71_02195 [Selenomonadaceae bacterium]|nr:hypothetical protein [Selenomonadaceae bacterium]